MSPAGRTRAATGPLVTERLTQLIAHDASAASTAAEVVGLAVDTLARSVLPDGRVCFTLQRTPAGDGAGTRPEGVSVRYAAIVALGADLLGEQDQRRALAGHTAHELCLRAVTDLGAQPELGDLAMTSWAASELAVPGAAALADRVLPTLRAAAAPPTVAAAWALTALVVAGRAEQGRELAGALCAASGLAGLFPHSLHPERTPRLRRHVGCFADQVYPVQALARYAAATGDGNALATAQRCADLVCALQGPQGQWWWHYDARTGQVVEGYPVYAVHQAGMAPMALLDLQDAGGRADLGAIALGLRWLQDPLEAAAPLVDPDERVVWRKVARREPVRKAVRGLRTAAGAVSPRLRLGLLDRACPPGPLDRESRPYEAGWALYAWLRST